MLNKRQYEQLLKPVNPTRVATREHAGKPLSYLEAWEVKAHLIRVFGFGGWDWTVTSAELVFEQPTEIKRRRNGQEEKVDGWSVGYKVIGTLVIHGIDLVVDDKNQVTTRDAVYAEAAVGSSTQPGRGDAHDMAIKSAESDALKRAAINLGDQFGLSLYKDGSLDAVVLQTLDQEAPSE